MDAFSKQLHLRGRVYEVRFQGELAYMLPLIERVRERSFTAHVEAIFASVEAKAWIEAHRDQLRAGTTLCDLHLLDIRAVEARDNLLRAIVLVPPTIAPPRQAASSPPRDGAQAPASASIPSPVTSSESQATSA